MFLRVSNRKKDREPHSYWSIGENKRLADNRVVQRHVLYKGEINSTQQEAWRRPIAVFCEGQPRPHMIALLPEDRAPEETDESSAMADLLEEDFGQVEIHMPYECLDLLTCNKTAPLPLAYLSSLAEMFKKVTPLSCDRMAPGNAHQLKSLIDAIVGSLNLTGICSLIHAPMRMLPILLFVHSPGIVGLFPPVFPSTILPIESMEAGLEPGTII